MTSNTTDASEQATSAAQTGATAAQDGGSLPSEAKTDGGGSIPTIRDMAPRRTMQWKRENFRKARRARQWTPEQVRAFQQWGEHPECNGSGPHTFKGEARVLPTSIDPMGSNDILCFNCYLQAMDWRREVNRKLSPSARFPFPKWENLEVYGGDEDQPASVPAEVPYNELCAGAKALVDNSGPSDDEIAGQLAREHGMYD